MLNCAVAGMQPKNNRSRATNRPLRLRGLHSQSIDGRRRCDLINSYVAALGGEANVPPLRMAQVLKAAELVAIAENLRRKSLIGEPVDLSELIRIENLAGRAEKQLNLSAPSARKGPTLEAYLASKREAPK